MKAPTGFVCSAFSTITPLAFKSPSRMRHPSSFSTRLSILNPQLFPSYSKTALSASSSSPNKKTKPPPLPTIDDPFLLLGLDSRNPTTDTKEIKRAYRKRAMQYHPDVILGTDSTAKEKAEASNDFARINAAYEMLTGGGKGSVGGSSAGSSSAGSGAKSSSTGGYKPPHRRESSYSSSYGKSTNWEDFMPNYDEEDTKYDSDGDSFGSIFSDIVSGAAGYAAGVSGSGGGSGGIVGDFVDFLERNVDGFESGYDDDKALSQLLTYGSFDEVASEMDETDILVTSLETKLSTVENELMQSQADLNLAVKFSEKLDLEERSAELKAREKVVKGYVKKCKKRLLRLRERYKALMVEGRGGRGYGGRSSSSGDSASGARSNSSGSSSRSNSGASSSRSSSYSRGSQPAPPASSTTSTSSTPTSAPAPTPASSSTKSWRDEGFKGSYGSRSSGSRRSSSRRSRGTTNADEPAAAKEQQSSQQQQRPANENVYSSGSSSNGSSASKTTSTSSKATPQQYEPWVPPHRRTQSTVDRDAQDKKKLRELKVDDDFEKLKREMGM